MFVQLQPRASRTIGKATDRLLFVVVSNKTYRYSPPTLCRRSCVVVSLPRRGGTRQRQKRRSKRNKNGEINTHCGLPSQQDKLLQLESRDATGATGSANFWSMILRVLCM
jgi:hypothetical protein